MADQFATAVDLQTLLGLSSIDTDRANLILAGVTAAIQEAAGGQRIIQVVDDTATLMGVANWWLDLPQIPVTAVESVTLDGTALTVGAAGDASSTYRLHGNRLFRGDTWQVYVNEPSSVVVVYTHGYAAGSQDLELAKATCLGLSRGIYDNPTGVARESIDDYSVSYELASSQIEASPFLKAAIRRKYGRRGGWVRVGV